MTRTADFQVAAIVPIAGAAADRDLAPVYPGITDADTLGDWDPPFPIDLQRVRPVDEEYWKQYRTTPKAFIPLEVGQRLWRSRYGDRTSVRIVRRPDGRSADARDRFATALRAAARSARARASPSATCATEGLAASRGATDFGEYFVYFSFFLVVSALLLAALFFRLGVEQRAREVGLLRAVGFTHAARAAAVRRRRPGAGGRRQRDRHRRRDRLRRADDGRPAHLVVGAVGTTRADAARVAAVAARRRGRRASSPRWSASGGRCAACRGSPSAACWPADRSRRRRDAAASTRRGRRSRLDRGDRARCAAAAVLIAAAIAGAIDPHRRVLRRRRRAARRLPVPASTCRLRRHAASALGGHGWSADARASASATPPNGPAAACWRSRVIASATFILISVDAFRRGDGRPRPIGTRASAATRCWSTCCCRSCTIRTARDGREALGLDAPTTSVDDRAVPRAARRRRELPESVRADATRASSASAAASSTRAASRSSRSLGDDRRRAREPVAAAAREPQDDGADPGHRRRELDDLRAAQGARRRHRHRRAATGRSGCGSWPRSPTASSRASC